MADTTPTVPVEARWWRLGRVATLVAIGGLLGLFAAGLAVFGVRGVAHPELFLSPAWSTGQVRQVLAGWGVPVGWFVGYWMLLELFLVAVSLVAAYVILRGAAGSWFRLYLALVLVLHATAGGAVLPILGTVFPALDPAGGVLQGLAWFALLPVAYVFPDGRFVPRFSRWLLLLWAATLVGLLAAPAGAPEGALAVVALGLFGSCVAAQTYRYLRVAGTVQRQQIRFVVIAVGLRFAYMVVILVTPVRTLMAETSARGLAVDASTSLASYLISAALPAAIAVAIVRYRLFDVDIWVNRALVYGLLTAFVLGTYGLLVGGVGALWRGGGAALSLLATALVAVAVQPVRSWAQRRVNRLVYGERDDPYAVVSRLGDRLGSALPPDTAPQTVVDTIGRAMRLPYVSLEFIGGPDQPAAWGAAPPGVAPVEFPVRSGGPEGAAEQLGTLRVAPPPGEPLRRADRTLLAEVARQAGLSVRAARLTADLRRSRQRIVTAAEEERRRLHRELHDSLGPTLTGVAFTADAVGNLIGTDPEQARAANAALRARVGEAIEDVRRLVYGLRPPTLGERGLVAALSRHAAQLEPGLPVTVTTAGPLPPLPAAVEVAAYRIATEALTNAARHAGTARALVSLTVVDGALRLSVTDDGTGGASRAGRAGDDAWRAGMGLRSMAERAAELGGTCEAGPTATGGRVVAVLPLGGET